MSASIERPASWTRTRLAGPLAIAAAVLAMVLSEGGQMTVRAIQQQRQEALEARLVVGKLRHQLLALESSQRGYLLTGRPAYREPYDQNLADIGVTIVEARKLASEYAAQQKTLSELTELAVRRVSELGELIRLYDAGNGDAAVQLMLTDIGRDQMVRIQTLADEVASEELATYNRTGRAREWVLLGSRIGIAVLVMLCLWAVFAAKRLARERDAQRQRHVEQLAADRTKLEVEVAHRTHELTELARHLQTVREDERSHLARELHDELGGLLTSAKLDVARVRKRLDLSVPEVAERITHLAQALDAGIALKRRIIEDLRPSSLDNLGLQRALQIHCEEFAQRSELQMKAQIGDVKLDDERALAAFRLVQEALTNILKYAKATEVQVGLRRIGSMAEVTVVDNGIGFDAARSSSSGHGLAGMAFRVRSCGGELKVHSSPGQGTRITATLPT